MARRRISAAEGQAALEKVRTNEASRMDTMTAVRYTLEELAERNPGQAVEVRVPPAGAVQILGGTTHRRGTPPAVVETDMTTWLDLALGHIDWSDAQVQASGERSDLSKLLPLF